MVLIEFHHIEPKNFSWNETVQFHPILIHQRVWINVSWRVTASS